MLRLPTGDAGPKLAVVVCTLGGRFRELEEAIRSMTMIPEVVDKRGAVEAVVEVGEVVVVV